jgi:uncharacterized membrane protein
MSIVIALWTVLFAVGAMFITVGTTSLLAHVFNGYYKASTGIATLLIGIALITLSLAMANHNFRFFLAMIDWIKFNF